MDQISKDAVKIFRRTMFLCMCVIGLWNFVSNVAARNKEHPSHSINGFPLWILNPMYVLSRNLVRSIFVSVLFLALFSTTTVWCVCTVIYTVITWVYAKDHPYWSVGALIIPLAMTGFMVWAGLDTYDWFTWGPLVAVLGIIVCAGIEVVASSAQSGMLRDTWNGLCGLDPPPPTPPPHPNTHAGSDIELGHYQQRRLRENED